MGPKIKESKKAFIIDFVHLGFHIYKMGVGFGLQSKRRVLGVR